MMTFFKESRLIDPCTCASLTDCTNCTYSIHEASIEAQMSLHMHGSKYKSTAVSNPIDDLLRLHQLNGYDFSYD